MIPKSSGRRPAISSPRSQRPRLVHWMLADYHHSSGANASAHDRFPDQHLKISARVRCLQVSSSRSPKSHVCSTALPSLSAGARNLPSLAKLDRRPHQPQPDSLDISSIVPPKAAFAGTAVTTGPARLRPPQAPLTGWRCGQVIHHRSYERRILGAREYRPRLGFLRTGRVSPCFNLAGSLSFASFLQ